ncbi:general substrate transporter [Aspergillus germanicus]
MDKPDVDMVERTDDQQLGYLADQEDHELGKWDSLKKYPWTFVWCVYAVWCILLVSFENQAAGNVTGIPQFRQDFGSFYEGNWVLDAKWQSAFNGGPVASAVVGALCSGQVADTFGRKWTMFGALLISVAAVTIEFRATTNEMFFGGKFLNGFALGALASVPVTYVGEIAPLALRGTLTCLTAMAYCIGPFIVALITNTTGNFTNRWAYRAVFAAQYGYAGVALAFIFFMPESPWWLVSKNREEKALASLRRLGYSDSQSTKKLASITTTLEQVRAETEGATYLECFRRSNLRRTIISIAPLSIQALSGVIFASSYSTYYMQLAGYSNSMSFRLQIAQQVMSIVGNAMSYFMIDRLGRRNLMLLGLFVMTCILMVTGGLGVVASDKSSPNADGAVKGTVALILVYCWWYNTTIGAAGYTILAEVSTSRLRVKTIAIGLALQNGLYTMWSFVLPYLFNPDKANLGAKVMFIFGGLSVICLVYLWFYQPETAGRTYGELDEMFMKGVPPRKFKSYQSDAQAMGMAVKEGREERDV